MAIYENLPVFKSSYDLLLEVFRMNVNLKRDYRYTLGERLKNNLTDMMVDIYRANSSAEKKPDCIREAMELVVEVKLNIRLLHDLGQIPTKRLAALSEKVEGISKQLTAWYKSTKQ